MLRSDGLPIPAIIELLDRFWSWFWPLGAVKETVHNIFVKGISRKELFSTILANERRILNHRPRAYRCKKLSELLAASRSSSLTRSLNSWSPVRDQWNITKFRSVRCCARWALRLSVDALLPNPVEIVILKIFITFELILRIHNWPFVALTVLCCIFIWTEGLSKCLNCAKFCFCGALLPIFLIWRDQVWNPWFIICMPQFTFVYVEFPMSGVDFGKFTFQKSCSPH